MSYPRQQPQAPRTGTAPPVPTKPRGPNVAPAAPTAKPIDPSNPPGAPPAKAAPAGPLRWLDLSGATVLVVLGAFAAFSLPAGPLRMLLTLPVLLFAPGYLLLQAFVVPPARGAKAGWQCLAAIGVSPAVVGLLALATAIVEGGFRTGAIVLLTTLGSLGFAAMALVRRRALARLPQDRSSKATAAPVAPAAPVGSPLGAPAPEAARAKSGPLRP